MELTLEQGRGYVLADKNKTPDMPIGVIPMDSHYTPVQKVNFSVDNTRVGQITDYDKLTLDVWTCLLYTSCKGICNGKRVGSGGL